MHMALSRFPIPLLLVMAFLVVEPGGLAPALGADCGAGVAPCSCGDRVVRDTVLSAKDPVLRDRCPCDGLTVAAAVKKLVVSGSIAGSGACTGIRLEPGASDAVITQGHIRDFSVGIDASGGVTRSRVSRLRLLGNLESGILVTGDDNVIEANQIRESLIFRAIAVSGNGNVVRQNRTEDSDRISVDGTGNTVSRNITTREGGLDISGASAMVDSNRATDGFGFRVEGSGHVVVRNDSARNSVPGFTVTGTGHRFADNEATDNLFDGFRVEATGSTFAGNASSLNSRLGIADLTTGGGTAGTANTYTDNTCVGNGLADSDPSGLCR